MTELDPLTQPPRVCAASDSILEFRAHKIQLADWVAASRVAMVSFWRFQFDCSSATTAPSSP
jgi:hypothetical protein